MKKIASLFLFLLMVSIALMGCVPQTKSTDAVVEDIPSDFITVSVDGAVMVFDNISFVEEKRDTDGDRDNIYGTLTLENSEYQVNAYCYLQYNRYDQGWLLDVCQLIDETYEVIPISGIDQSVADTEMYNNYESFTLEDRNVLIYNNYYATYFLYNVSDEYDFFTYNGNVELLYTMNTGYKSENGYENEINIYWDERFNEPDSTAFEWDVEGSWYSPSVGGGGYELFMNTSSFDGDSIYVDAVSPYKGDEYRDSGERMDFKGTVDVTYDYSSSDDPTLSYHFVIQKDGSAGYTITVHKDFIELNRDRWPTVELYRN